MYYVTFLIKLKFPLKVDLILEPFSPELELECHYYIQENHWLSHIHPLFHISRINYEQIQCTIAGWTIQNLYHPPEIFFFAYVFSR